MAIPVNRVGSEELIGFRDIAARIGLPPQTARRYAAAFPRWLPSRTIGRAMMFSPECLPVFAQIRECFEAGQTTAEVSKLLEETRPITVDEPPAPQSETNDLARLVIAFERMAVSLEVIAERLEAQTGLPERPVEATENKIRPGHHAEEETAVKSPLRRWWRKMLGGGDRGE